jgi:hypothetical protein
VDPSCHEFLGIFGGGLLGDELVDESKQALLPNEGSLFRELLDPERVPQGSTLRLLVELFHVIDCDTKSGIPVFLELLVAVGQFEEPAPPRQTQDS